MSYKKIGKQKILDELTSTNLALKMANIDKGKEIHHLYRKLAEGMNQNEGKAISVGWLAAQSFFIGQEYQASIKNQEKRSTP